MSGILNKFAILTFKIKGAYVYLIYQIEEWQKLQWPPKKNV